MKIAALVTAFLLAIGSTASGSTVLNFDNGGTDGGTLSYDGVGGALVGTDIIFDRIRASGAPLNNGEAGELRIANGQLDFQTGANIQENAPLFGGAVYEWAGGGSFILTGDAYFDANDSGSLDSGEQVASGVLLSGSFVGSTVGFRPSALADWLFTSAGVDQKHQGILDHFGITSTEFVYAATEISATFNPAGNGSFSTTVKEADVVNTAVSPAVPEPTTMALGALGALALAAGRRGRRQARA